MSEDDPRCRVNNVIFAKFDHSWVTWTPDYGPRQEASLPLPLTMALPDRKDDATYAVMLRQL